MDVVPKISSADLAAALLDGRMDAGIVRLLEKERPYIAARRQRYGIAGTRGPAALALSGGGIRSAAFALGVVQRLARSDYLRVFDYLSTVSGGGYLGASLTWFLSAHFRRESERHRLPPGVAAADLEFGVGHAAAEPLPYGTSDPAEVPTRTTQGLAYKLMTYLRAHGQYLIPGDGITLLSGIAVVLRGIVLNLAVWFPLVGLLLGLLALVPNGFRVVFVVSVLLWVGFLLAAMAYSLITWKERSPEARRYRWRRSFERWAGDWILAGALLLVVGTLPWVTEWTFGYIGKKGGVAFLVSGGAGGIWSFFKTRSAAPGGLPLNIVAPLAGVVFLYAFMMLAYDTGAYVIAPAPDAWDGEMGWRYLLLATPVVAAALGYFVNHHYLTVHPYYRDRLMEAFMPDIGLVVKNEAGAAFIADPAPLSAMIPEAPTPDKARAPYHVVNANLILTQTKDKVRKARGGDSFILSPFYCGSSTTGWRRTAEFMANEMTLPTAMAISGAAANPDTGTGGVGLTRNPIVSIVMSLFNIRLGYWIPQPSAQRQRNRPNHFYPGLTDLLGFTGDENSTVLRLTDGGHFDNLGLYEMIRRRAEFILVSDAGADPDFTFSDVTTMMVRVQQDFGAVIVFEGTPPLERLMPSGKLPFPEKALFSKTGFARAKITYVDGSEGTLLYVTTTIVDGLRLQLLGYLGANPTFPDETTADQFFDEAQFEAYRELGYVVAGKMLEEHSDEFERRL